MTKTCIISFSLVLSLFAGCNYFGNLPKCDGNCINGYGVKNRPDGGYEKGHWRKGELYGEGEQFFGSASQFAGDRYVGGFDSCYSGYGTYYGKRLDFVHKGYWKNGKPDGHGVAVFGTHTENPGWRYEGEWKDGQRTGYGTLYFGSRGKRAGIKYVGYLIDGNMDREGKYYWPDGDRYEGHFSNDLFDGQGTFYFKDGTKYSGEWQRGGSLDFLQLLQQHSKTASDKDSVLVRFFLK